VAEVGAILRILEARFHPLDITSEFSKSL
jgi:hypothetical protein